MSVWDDVVELNRELTVAARRCDATTPASLYDEDARFVVAGSPTYRGAAEMARLRSAFLSSGPVDIAYERYLERCMVVYRRRAGGRLAILVDAPVREP